MINNITHGTTGGVHVGHGTTEDKEVTGKTIICDIEIDTNTQTCAHKQIETGRRQQWAHKHKAIDAYILAHAHSYRIHIPSGHTSAYSSTSTSTSESTSTFTSTSASASASFAHPTLSVVCCTCLCPVLPVIFHILTCWSCCCVFSDGGAHMFCISGQEIHTNVVTSTWGNMQRVECAVGMWLKMCSYTSATCVTIPHQPRTHRHAYAHLTSMHICMHTTHIWQHTHPSVPFTTYPHTASHNFPTQTLPTLCFCFLSHLSHPHYYLYYIDAVYMCMYVYMRVWWRDDVCMCVWYEEGVGERNITERDNKTYKEKIGVGGDERERERRGTDTRLRVCCVVLSMLLSVKKAHRTSPTHPQLNHLHTSDKH
jgi:hypothetical protein